MLGQRGWPALLAIVIIFLLHRSTNGEITSSLGGEINLGLKNLRVKNISKDFEGSKINKVRGYSIDSEKHDPKSSRSRGYQEKILNINKAEDERLVSRDFESIESNVGIAEESHVETGNEERFFSIKKWRLEKKSKEKTTRVKRRSEAVVSNVEIPSLRYSDDEKMVKKSKNENKVHERDFKSFVKGYSTSSAKSKIFADDQPASKSFNDSNGDKSLGENVESDLYEEDSDKPETQSGNDSSKNSNNDRLMSDSKIKNPLECSDASERAEETKFNKKLRIGLSRVNYPEYIEAEHSDSNIVEGKPPVPKYELVESYRRADVARDMKQEGDVSVVVVANKLGHSESTSDAADISEKIRGAEDDVHEKIDATDYEEIGLQPAISAARKREDLIPVRSKYEKIYDSSRHSELINPGSIKSGIITVFGTENETRMSAGDDFRNQERKAFDKDETKTTFDITAGKGVGGNSSADEEMKRSNEQREDIELGNSSAGSNALEDLYDVRRNLSSENKGGDNSLGIKILPKFFGNQSDAGFKSENESDDSLVRVRLSEKIVKDKVSEKTKESKQKSNTIIRYKKIDINSPLKATQNGVREGLSLTLNLFGKDKKNETRGPSKTNLLDKLWWAGKPKVVNLSALDISGGVGYEDGFKNDDERLYSDEEKGKRKNNNNDETKLSESKARAKVDIGREFSPKKLSDERIITSKIKRDMKLSGTKIMSLTKREEEEEGKVENKINKSSFVSDSVNEVSDGKSENVSLLNFFTLLNKSETSTRPTTTFGSILGAVSESWENNTLLFLRSFSSPRKEYKKDEEEEEEVTTRSVQSEELYGEKNDFISEFDDNSTESNDKIFTKNNIEPSYLNNDNESTATTRKILKALEPLNSDLIDEEKLSSFVDNLISTETPLKTTLDIFEAITQSLNPPIIFNQTDSENTSRVLTAQNQWPVKHSAVVEGDLVLGGLMMVHEREDSVTCGPVMAQGGVQALEAMLYTLDRLNSNDTVPGVKIGAHILDDCDKDTYGLEMAVDFIKGSISNIDGAEYHCNKTAVRKVISGVVGAASSVTSIQVANLLRLFRIPQVSFFSTSPELSNKQRFEYFTRTIPSDHWQVKAMVDIVRTMNWSYVSIIYEESNYGIKAFEELEELLSKYNICIAIKEKLVKDSGVAEETAYDNIVLKLLTKPRARGCIIFGSDQEVAGVMRAVRRCNATGLFSWIGSDGWSARGLVSDGNQPEVEGTLSVQPQANPIQGFEEYFLNLTVENNKRNPWFVEFWEAHFKCRYPNASWTPYNEKYTKPCNTSKRLTKQDTAFENQLQFVSDAVTAFAYAFRDMHLALCNRTRGLCDAMKPTKGTELLKFLRKVNFEGLSGDKFKFDKNGDGPARYNIIHFKQVSPGVYKWLRVGEYVEGELRLDRPQIQFRMTHPAHPESVCSLPCEVGQAKKYVEGESCCWHCFNCTQYQVRHPGDETQCILCPQGTVPDETRSNCSDIPEEFLRPESGWAIGAMSFSATGILVTLFVGGVFVKHSDTPIVRASDRDLSYVLLTGILLCYLVTFTFVLRPNNIVCGVQRFGAGFCFTVVYAALLTKTNRISRIFNAGRRGVKRPSFTLPKSQLIICSGLMGVQILINGVWMIIDPAKSIHHYPTREDNLLVCSSYVDASYMIAFAYPIILIVVCTVYAVLTRKIPAAFNESKHIGFTMYTTCVIWLAFVPLYFGTGNHVALRITSMSVTISLSASVTIACLFSPKLYIILIRPERNVRQNISTTRSAVTGTNAAPSVMAALELTAVTCDQNNAVKRHVTTTIDCSTQIENHDMEMQKGDRLNGKTSINFINRSTQTQIVEFDCNTIGGRDCSTGINNKDLSTTTTTTTTITTNAGAPAVGGGGIKQLNNINKGNRPPQTLSNKDVEL